MVTANYSSLSFRKQSLWYYQWILFDFSCLLPLFSHLIFPSPLFTNVQSPVSHSHTHVFSCILGRKKNIGRPTARLTVLLTLINSKKSLLIVLKLYYISSFFMNAAVYSFCPHLNSQWQVNPANSINYFLALWKVSLFRVDTLLCSN